MKPEQRRASPRAKEFAAFLLFGGAAAAVNLAVGWQLYGRGLYPDLPYWCATAIAAASGLVVNFALNHFFNFKFRDRSTFEQFGTFCIASLVGIGITSALSSGMLLLFTASGIAWVKPALLAHVCAVGLTVLYSYPAHRAVSFNMGIGARLRLVHAQLAARI